VNYLLNTAVNPDTEVHLPFPEFAQKKFKHESFDAVVISGSKCAMIECKGGFLKAKAKYADSEEEFLSDLNLKFGTEPRAGVEQLVRKIGQIFARKPSDRRAVDWLNPEEIDLLIPILVVQEQFVSSIFTAPWLAKTFRDCMRKKELIKRLIWTGLVVMNVEELEAIRPCIASCQFSFFDCLMHRVRLGDPGSGDKMFTFSDTFENFLKVKGISPPSETDFTDRFDRIFNRASLRFFGRPFEPSQD
jgi:hypothetical protein